MPCVFQPIRRRFISTWVLLIFAFPALIANSHGQLQSALEVRSLSFEEAEAAMPVELTATVIFPDPPATIFIQDETAGTFFRLGGAKTPQVGDQVRVRGRSITGLYLPGIEEATFEVIAHPGLPDPLPVTYEDLASGKYHYQYVSVEGVVRSIEPTAESAGLALISLGTQKLEIRLDELNLPDGLDPIGTRVRVRGLAAGEINQRRQLIKPYLRVPGWAEIETLSRAPTFAEIPVVTPRELFTFQVEKRSETLARITGQVTAKLGNTIYLRNGEIPFAAESLHKDTDVEISDQVEIVGFPEMRGFRALIADSRIVNRAPGESIPQPSVISWKELKSGDWDGNLVSAEGILANVYHTEDETRMAITSRHDSTSSVPVRVSKRISHLQPGMELSISGICLVESTRTAQYRAVPDLVSIQARSADDIRILKAPAWWTARRLGRALAFLTFITFFAGLWIHLLRRQVSRQTAELRSGIEQQAALEERQRIAREFHDTLEQDLAGLSLRLDAAAAHMADTGVQKFITGARSLVSRIQTETRNLVADLRESPGKMADLNAALRELSPATTPGQVGPEVFLSLDEKVSTLPTRVVHHLKMIAGEAVTNAIKHAQATRIEIKTLLEDKHLTMMISDDGKGFNADRESKGRSGHFGCMGMRERARKVNATITWKSDTQGTSVIVTLSPGEEV